MSCCFTKVMMLLRWWWGRDLGHPMLTLMPALFPSNAQLVYAEGAWWVVCVNTPDMGPHNFPIMVPSLIPGPHGGGCARSCQWATRMFPLQASNPLQFQGLHPSQGWKQDPAVPCAVLVVARVGQRAMPQGAQPSISARRGGYGLVPSLAPQASTDPRSEDTREVLSSTQGSLAWPWGCGRRLGLQRLSTGRTRLPILVLGLVLSPGPDPAGLGEAGSREKAAQGCLPPVSTQ